MKRSRPLARSTRLQRGKPKRKPPSMQDLAHPKPKIYPFNLQFLAWLRTQECMACHGAYSFALGAVEAAHLDSCRYGDERNAVSLHGRAHHREGQWSLHVMGRKKFQRHWKLNLRKKAREQFAQFQVEQMCAPFTRAFE